MDSQVSKYFSETLLLILLGKYPEVIAQSYDLFVFFEKLTYCFHIVSSFYIPTNSVHKFQFL